MRNGSETWYREACDLCALIFFFAEPIDFGIFERISLKYGLTPVEIRSKTVYTMLIL